MKYLLISAVVCLVQLSTQKPQSYAGSRSGGGWGTKGNWGEIHKGHGHGSHDNCHHTPVTTEKIIEEGNKGGEELIITGGEKSGGKWGEGNHESNGNHGQEDHGEGSNGVFKNSLIRGWGHQGKSDGLGGGQGQGSGMGRGYKGGLGQGGDSQALGNELNQPGYGGSAFDVRKGNL